MPGDSKGDCSWLKASQEVAATCDLRSSTRPKFRAWHAWMPRHFTQLCSVQNALATESSSERQTRVSRLGEMMTLERSFEGENERLKLGTRAFDLLVLGARALILIGRC